MKKLFVILMMCFSGTLWAFEKAPFDKQAFDQAQKDGIPVLVDIYASWCPTCERQQIILKRYFENNPQSPIKVFVVDFDKDKEWVKHFKAPRQSTLYLYKKGEQVWFSVAQTSTRVIEEALDKMGN